MKKLILTTVVFITACLSVNSQIVDLKIDGLSKSITFINNGIDFDKIFVLTTDNTGRSINSWENAFARAGLRTGSYYFDSEEKQYVCSGDYMVTLDIKSSGIWSEGTLIFTDLDDNSIVGRVIMTTTAIFLRNPNSKQTKVQAGLLRTLAQNISAPKSKISETPVFPKKWFSTPWLSSPQEVLDSYDDAVLEKKEGFSMITLRNRDYSGKPVNIDFLYDNYELTGGIIWYEYDGSFLEDSTSFDPVVDNFFNIYSFLEEELGEPSDESVYPENFNWDKLEESLRMGDVALDLNWNTDKHIINLSFGIVMTGGEPSIALYEMYLL
jgi:hypothetical protein